MTSAEEWQLAEWRAHEPWRLDGISPLAWLAKQDDHFMWDEPVEYLPAGSTRFASLPCVAGVYILNFGEDVLYIGKATSLAHRVKAHWMERRIPFDRVAWICLPVIAAEMLEAFFIGEIKPPCNAKFCHRMADWHKDLQAHRKDRNV